MVGLCVVAGLFEQTYAVVVRLTVCLGVLQEVFEQSESLRHILAKSRETYSHLVVFHVDGVRASELIELFVYLCRRLLVSAYIIKVLWHEIEAAHVFCSKIVAEHEFKQSVAGVLLVDDGQSLARLGHGDVFLQVEEDRLYGFGFA